MWSGVGAALAVILIIFVLLLSMVCGIVMCTKRSGRSRQQSVQMSSYNAGNSQRVQQQQQQQQQQQPPPPWGYNFNSGANSNVYVDQPTLQQATVAQPPPATVAGVGVLSPEQEPPSYDAVLQQHTAPPTATPFN